MSTYRPYYNAEQFRYPEESGIISHDSHSSFSKTEKGSEPFDYLDFDDLIAGHSQISAVGVSVWRFYLRLLVSQPFEVSRFLLQVGEFSYGHENISYEDYEFDKDLSSSSDEEVDYFVDVRDNNASRGVLNIPEKSSTLKVKASKTRGVQLFTTIKDPLFPEAITLNNGPYIFGCLGALNDKEGFFGWWRALNASCLCRAATGVLQAWSTSFLAAITAIPDPQFVDILQSVDPLKIFALGTAGCALTAALLTPIYMVRARLVATSMTKSDRPRSLRWSLLDIVRNGKFLAPWSVVLPTTLSATTHYSIMAGTPLILWKLFSINSWTSPRLYQFCQLGANMFGLIVHMPLETLASRAQLKACHPTARTLIIRPIDYQGIFATLWSILKGKVYLSSLYRGWRSEVVGMLSEWGYDALNDEKPNKQERF